MRPRPLVRLELAGLALSLTVGGLLWRPMALLLASLGLGRAVATGLGGSVRITGRFIHGSSFLQPEQHPCVAQRVRLHPVEIQKLRDTLVIGAQQFFVHLM